MKTFIIALLASASALADTNFAVVDGTNVVLSGVCDLSKYTPPVGKTYVTNGVPYYVAKGWRYVGGVFLQPNGSPAPATNVAVATRLELIQSATADLNEMQTAATSALANWATLTAGQKDAAQKRVIVAVKSISEVLEKLLVEKRSELFEIKDAD